MPCLSPRAASTIFVPPQASRSFLSHPGFGKFSGRVRPKYRLRKGNPAGMKSIVVVGAQWGDEGKGKVVDYMAASFDYIARCAGGHNAGHTVIYNGNRFVLQLIPCGILRPGKHAVIGAGVVVDPAAMVAELDNLNGAGIDVRGRLHLAARAHLIFPYHRQMEKAAEAARGAAKIGTTSRGIGPAYEDKMARCGLRVCDLLEPPRFREKLARVVEEKNAICRAAYGAPLDVQGLCEEYLQYAERLRPLVVDASSLLNRALDEGRSVLFEGAQGTMLDIDYGTYPFVTSSSATSGGAATGVLLGVVHITDHAIESFVPIRNFLLVIRPVFLRLALFGLA